jgi:hypothetical protein
MEHRRVVAPAKRTTDVGQRMVCQLTREIHRGLARPGDRFEP